MTDPLISVLLPFYNGLPYIKTSLQSILAQTFTDFEVIVIDDGSADDSFTVVQQFGDPRIRLYRQENVGLAATLNRAIGLARGTFLARQDQDDISLPYRFEKQVSFLSAHPLHAMVGTWSKIWVGNRKTWRSHQHPSESTILKWELLFDNPFVHSSVMIRKSVLEILGGYSTDPSRQPPEDYELWSRIARQFAVANIPEFLHIYREVPRSMCRNGVNPFAEKVLRLSAENISWAIGQNEPDQLCFDLAALAHGLRERVSPGFEMEKAAEALVRAADRLATSDAARSRLRKRAKSRLRDIEYVHAQSTRDRLIAFARRLPYRLPDRLTVAVRNLG